MVGWDSWRSIMSAYTYNSYQHVGTTTHTLDRRRRAPQCTHASCNTCLFSLVLSRFSSAMYCMYCMCIEHKQFIYIHTIECLCTTIGIAL